MSQSNIVFLPTKQITPDEIIQALDADVEHIKSIVCIVQWQDGSFSTQMSTLSLSDLCMAARILNIDIDRDIEERTEG